MQMPGPMRQPARRRWMLLQLFLALTFTLACSPGQEADTKIQSPSKSSLPFSTLTPAVVQEKRAAYREVLGELAKAREQLREKYAAAQNTKSRSRVLEEARQMLTRT